MVDFRAPRLKHARRAAEAVLETGIKLSLMRDLFGAVEGSLYHPTLAAANALLLVAEDQ
jgi:hypothetical protein